MVNTMTKEAMHHLQVTIDVRENGAVMTENVIRLENPEDNEMFRYTREDDYLIMVCLISNY